MKMQKLIAAALFLSFVATGAIAEKAQAHGDDCPICDMPVEKNNAKVDNVVTMKTGSKVVGYRCVFCAFADASGNKNDVSVKAPTEVKGRFVTLTRKSGKWTSSIPGAVFVSKKANHRHCPETYRALTSAKAFPAYAKKNPMVAGTKPLSLAQMIAVSK